jgi:Adenylate and Guanylate cyclase catalytic domain
MRIGVNSGLAVVTQIRGESAAMTALGDTVNLASRLQTLSEPGTVCLSEATQRLVQGLVETTFAGARPIKGNAEPQKVYRLNSVREGTTRFEAAVGRGLTCACRKSKPNILVVQPAEDRAAKNGPGQFDSARDRCILLQR